jgi:hypothetical protein
MSLKAGAERQLSAGYPASGSGPLRMAAPEALVTLFWLAR